MKFEKIIPTDRLKPYVKYLVIAENQVEQEYKVFPSTGLVMGFQYKGNLSFLDDSRELPLSAAGITGMADRFKTFKNSAGTGTVLVYFTETGISQFSSSPVNELFNLSVSLHNLFDKNRVAETEEKLSGAATDRERVKIVERFLLGIVKEKQSDRLIVEAVKMIYQSKGNIRIRELSEKLFISQSPLEKRFRKVVGTTPKKFAAVVRFNTVLSGLNETKTLTEIAYDNHFFDQAHFIKDFKQFTGETPEHFKRLR